MAVVASPLSPAKAFRARRRPDGRVAIGAGLAVLAFLALAFGLLQVLPETQAVVHATRDLEAGRVLQPEDVAVAQVHLPRGLAAATFDAPEQVVGNRLDVPLKAGQLLAPSQFAARHAAVAGGRVQPTVPIEPYTADGGRLGRGDRVIVYGTPRQAAPATRGSAEVIVDHARVVDVRPADGAAGGISASATGRPLLLTLDLAPDEAARLVFAARLDYLDVVLVGDDEATGDAPAPAGPADQVGP